LERVLPLLRSAGIILAQLEIPMETIEYLCAAAHRLQVPLILDPAPARRIPRKMLRQVTFLTPNETETCTLCGIHCRNLNPATVAEFARTLQSKGATNVIIKMGSNGAYVAGANGLRKMVPAFKVRAVDSAAAGDAFNGGLGVALMQGKGLEEAVRFGAAVAALSVTRRGAQPSMPTAREVSNLLKRHEKRLIHAA
jgi:ribokinase